ncbi:hypothetical protein JW935_14545 [candidate division KSB1 bacterium]|nr:hypothetical protein [candidate division KSB1 bacterium]
MKKIVFLLCVWVGLAAADILVTVQNEQIEGTLSNIADTYIEFKLDNPVKQEWIKVEKKNLMAVVDQKGKIVYPRDKYDENALNYGRIKINSREDAKKYAIRKQQNLQVQRKIERRDSSQFRTAVIVGGISGLMLWAFLDTKN